MLMASREPIQIVEIDVDYCTLTYGTAPCTAVLGTTGTYKCFNTYATCQAKTAFTKSAKTLRFVNNRANLPKGLVAFPCLNENGITAFSSTVNIAGSDDKMSAFGRRATVSVKLMDFVYDDIGFDKYQSQRISGAAQTGGVGYDPITKGTFFTKLKSRFPYYAGRALRVIDGYIDDGVLSDTKTRNFIITDMNGPDNSGNVVFEAKDVLALADNDKAVVPKAGRGKLGANVTAAVGQTFSLTPAGIESEYPASGWAIIGSEIVAFTRAAAVITLTQRGLYGTVAATHNINDTFQLCYNVVNQRVDDLIYDLLVNYAGVPASYCNLSTDWKTEVDTWLSGLLLNTVIAKPTGVAQLIGELAILGISIWWDEVNQKVRLLVNHPATSAATTPISDRNNVKKIVQEDRDEDRLTQIHFYSKQTDPTKDYKSKDNYNQINVTIDTDAENTNAYGTPIIKEVFCRWLNNGGADAFVTSISQRLLSRFNTAPKRYTILLDAKDRDLGLAEVLSLDSRIVTDPTGNVVTTLLQVIKTTEKRSGHEYEVVAQAFQYDGRYGFITSNTTPVYSLATDDQKRVGAFFVNESTLLFSDGSAPYALI
jgi:hypothetical protein